MFGVGPQELVVIVLLLLVIFGPGKAVSMARDLGRFANEARRPLEELKTELILSEEVKEAQRSVEEFKDEAQRSVEGLKTGVAVGEEEGKPSSDIPPDEDEAREPKKGKELAREEEASSSEKGVRVLESWGSRGDSYSVRQNH